MQEQAVNSHGGAGDHPRRMQIANLGYTVFAAPQTTGRALKDIIFDVTRVQDAVLNTTLGASKYTAMCAGEA